MNILFLSTEIPFPLDHGHHLRTANVLKCLAEDHNIYFLGFSKNENNRNLQCVTEKTWKSGARVAIEQGPFAGYHCIFQEQRGIDRAYVLLDIIGKQTRATLLKEDLQIPQFTKSQ